MKKSNENSVQLQEESKYLITGDQETCECQRGKKHMESNRVATFQIQEDNESLVKFN